MKTNKSEILFFSEFKQINYFYSTFKTIRLCFLPIINVIINIPLQFLHRFVGVRNGVCQMKQNAMQILVFK